MTKSLSKNELILGSKAVRDVPLDSMGGGTVRIRPLTSDEYAQIETELVKSLGIELDMSAVDFSGATSPEDIKRGIKPTFDIAQFAGADHRSRVLAVAFGLSVDGEEWSADEAGQLRPEVLKEISEAVYEFSGVEPGMEDVMRSFRANARGSRGPASADARRSSRPNSSRPHAGSTADSA